MPPNRIAKVLPGTLTLLLPDAVSAVVAAALPAEELPELAPAILSGPSAVPPMPIAALLPSGLKLREDTFEGLDLGSGWGTLQIGRVSSAVCSGQQTVERTASV